MHDHGDKLLERLVFFSDAVFAIAITLLVVEIEVPVIRPGPDEVQLAWEALAQRLPRFIGFFISFFVIGSFWAHHHRAFGLLGRHDRSFVWPNLQLLFVIAFLPFATSFMSANSGQFVPNLVYLLTLMVAGLLLMWLLYRVLRPEYAGDGVTAAEMWPNLRRAAAVPLACLIGVAMDFAVPAYATLPLILIPLLIRWLGKPWRSDGVTSPR